MRIQFTGLPTDHVVAVRNGAPDAYGHSVERHHTEDGTWPCRHCLGDIPAGSDYLILAYRPFARLNPYTETGPIFLCAADCPAYAPSRETPDILRAPSYLVRAYDSDERILYGTGQVTPTGDIARYASELLNNPDVAFVDVRSAANNCFQCRVLRQ